MSRHHGAMQVTGYTRRVLDVRSKVYNTLANGIEDIMETCEDTFSPVERFVEGGRDRILAHATPVEAMLERHAAAKTKPQKIGAIAKSLGEFAGLRLVALASKLTTSILALGPWTVGFVASSALFMVGVACTVVVAPPVILSVVAVEGAAAGARRAGRAADAVKHAWSAGDRTL